MYELRKVKSGDALQIPARAYNAFVDAALDHQRRQMSTSADAQRDKDRGNIVLVKNESGAARSRFDVLGITGPIIRRVDNAATFMAQIALRGETPAAVHAGRFVILLDVIPNGTIGRANIAGACLARVRMLDEAHTAADVDDGQAGHLASGATGAVSLLWVEPVGERVDPAIAWAVIRFGGMGGGASSAALPYAKIESSIGTMPPFVYTGRDVAPAGSGAFGSPAGSDFDLYNLSEIGAGGTGVHAVPNGSIVAYWQDAATGDRFFDRSFYRGTF